LILFFLLLSRSFFKPIFPTQLLCNQQTPIASNTLDPSLCASLLLKRNNLVAMQPMLVVNIQQGRCSRRPSRSCLPRFRRF
ncbi:hypothetical protein KCU98_g13, partial [Aureobasidium melanogenum]